MALNPVSFFKSLADETRLRMLMLLTTQGELCVCELGAALQDSQPKISRHLAQLKTAGVLQSKRQGKWIYYRLHPQLPAWASTVLHQAANGNQPYVKKNQQRLATMCNRPERCC